MHRTISACVLIVLLLLAGSVSAMVPLSEDELSREAGRFYQEEKYGEALKTYETLLMLTRHNHGTQHRKVAAVLIEMSLVYRYGLGDEKNYTRLQDEAKNIEVTLNGTVKCADPKGWDYTTCRERWLGPDQCFQFRHARAYIKVTRYGLAGSEFTTPERFVAHLKGLFGTFEAVDTMKVDGREATRIRLRYKSGGFPDRDGRYRHQRWLYEEFLVVPLATGFLTFNFDLSNYMPIPADIDRESGPAGHDREVYTAQRDWTAFLKSCRINP